jgi:putative hemolysin
MVTLPQPLLSGLLTRPRYSVRLAATRNEVRAAQRLRFEVFNLELREGLAASYATGLDEDPFDAVCDHLIVVDEVSGAVVGTYRLQTGLMAAQGLGYYSAQEFDFRPFEPLRNSLVELGRACVHRDHRSLAVISLLWREIIRYVLGRCARYMIGCSSLTSQDPALGRAMFAKLADTHLADAALRTEPLPGYALTEGAPASACPPPPKLLRAYLSVGAKICGPPAIDRAFRTIDFLTILDCQDGAASAWDHFVRRPS